MIFCTLDAGDRSHLGTGHLGQVVVLGSATHRHAAALVRLSRLPAAAQLQRSGERTARFAAIYGIVGSLLIPLNYYIIEIFGGRGMHPENLERGSLGEGMGVPFLMATSRCSSPSSTC